MVILTVSIIILSYNVIRLVTNLYRKSDIACLFRFNLFIYTLRTFINNNVGTQTDLML